MIKNGIKFKKERHNTTLSKLEKRVTEFHFSIIKLYI